MTWQQAQEKARRETGINYVFAPENQAVIGGYEGFGFSILVPQGCVFANTVNPNSILTKIQHLSWWARSLNYLAHQDKCCENHQFNSGIYTK